MLLLIPIIIAFLGAYSGKEGTSLAWRRFGIPIIAMIVMQSLQPLLMALPLSLGYGIPDEDDEGGFLGRIFKYGWLTRGIWAFLVMLSLFQPTENWAVMTALITMLFAAISVKNYGKLWGMLIVDLAMYFWLGVAILVMEVG